MSSFLLFCQIFGSIERVVDKRSGERISEKLFVTNFYEFECETRVFEFIL